MRSAAIAGVLVLLSLLPSGRTNAQTQSTDARRRAVRRLPTDPAVVVVTDDFRNGTEGWEGGFADYSTVSSYMNLEAGLRPLPPELGIEGTGFFLGGDNHSDDLFMFLMRKLTIADGIQPGQPYEITFRIRFASQAGSTCGGIGGSPGESVYLKAGASGEEPKIVVDSSNHFRLTVDKGNQAVGGPAGSVTGTISNGSSDCSANPPFIMIDRVHVHPFVITSSSEGELWLLVGTDSGFEGRTELYYESISAILIPAH